MGAFKNLSLILKTYFPDEENYSKLLAEFLLWLDNKDGNDVFVPSRRSFGYYLDLCNSEEVYIDIVCEYWAKHIKLGIHDGEGFVVKQ